MADIAEIVLCPRCRGEMNWEGNDLSCDCGWRLELSNGFFKMKDEIDGEASYAEFYTEEYYNSDLYDYTGYRLNRILSFARAEEVEGSSIWDAGQESSRLGVQNEAPRYMGSMYRRMR